MPELYALIGQYGLAAGALSLRDTPGLWKAQIDESLSVAINPHPEVTDGIDPYHACLYWKDWPAAVLSPVGGTVIGDNDTDNETMLCDRLRAAIKRLK